MAETLSQYCNRTSYALMKGLHQHVKIVPVYRTQSGGQAGHYYPRAFNSARVLTFKMAGVNPVYQRAIFAHRSELGSWAGATSKSPVRMTWEGTTVFIEIPKPGAYWDRVTIEKIQKMGLIRGNATVTVGLGLQNNPIMLRFAGNRQSHILLAGEERSGKTNGGRYIAWNLAAANPTSDVAIIIMDVAKKAVKWDDFGKVAHLRHPIITDEEESARVLAWLDQEKNRRYETRNFAPRLFVFIDELKSFIERVPGAAEYLTSLASEAGEAGIHLITATQYPQVKNLGGDSSLKENLSIRLCGRVASATSAANIMGVGDSGAEGLQGYGDFLLKSRGQISRVTLAHLTPEHTAKLPHREPDKIIDLPPAGDMNGPTPQYRQPDPIEPEQVAYALWNPEGIGKTRETIGGGSAKAKRVRQFADKVMELAYEQGMGAIDPENYLKKRGLNGGMA